MFKAAERKKPTPPHGQPPPENAEFHACENPLDVFKYYPPATSRYCKVDLDANEQKEDDSGRVGKKILILAEISLQDMKLCFAQNCK